MRLGADRGSPHQAASPSAAAAARAQASSASGPPPPATPMAGEFVAGHQRRAHGGHAAFVDVDVGQAQAAGTHLDGDFVGTGGRQFDFADRQGLVEGFEDGGFHGAF